MLEKPTVRLIKNFRGAPPPMDFYQIYSDRALEILEKDYPQGLRHVRTNKPIDLSGVEVHMVHAAIPILITGLPEHLLGLDERLSDRTRIVVRSFSDHGPGASSYVNVYSGVVKLDTAGLVEDGLSIFVSRDPQDARGNFGNVMAMSLESGVPIVPMGDTRSMLAYPLALLVFSGAALQTDNGFCHGVVLSR